MKKSFRVFLLCAALIGCSAGGGHAAALQQGDVGEQVQTMQRQLKIMGYQIEPDGQFGEGTKAVVAAFQKAHGLTPDGIFGQATENALYGRNSISAPVANAGNYAGGSSVLDIATQFYGVPYVWGGNSPAGFDCSGFVQYVFSQAGVNLPRMCDGQFYTGTPVEKSDLRPGDVVFFETYEPGPSHVGIYIGGGEFIHASSNLKQICNDTLNREYRIRTYLGARRYL